MAKLFGTDGIRGVANAYPMTAEMALRVGRAVTGFFGSQHGKPIIVIGQDSRISGDMLASALAAGICSAGGDAALIGMVPTPAIAYYTTAIGAQAGIVISASHNPYYDNGIKVFGPDGYKLDDAAERELENRILADAPHRDVPGTRQTGRVERVTQATEQYADFLMGTLPDGFSLNGMAVVLDCANGATAQVAPHVFERLGAQVTALSVSPDGVNINARCGSQHPEVLAETVVRQGADIGLAFDGDGDRLIAVDETGGVLTGDQILAVCAESMCRNGSLKNNRVVTTVMSNLGFREAMNTLGVEHHMAQVGDRYVLEKMKAVDACLGGEDSGHMIFLDHHTTGDGLLAALRLVAVLRAGDRPLSVLRGVMSVFPQVLINVDVTKKPDINTIPEIRQAIEAITVQLGDQGRVLVRYSGTQAMCRVMVEGPTEVLTRQYCEEIANCVQKAIGK